MTAAAHTGDMTTPDPNPPSPIPRAADTPFGIPDAPWAQAAVDLVYSSEPRSVANHSMRSWVFAWLLAEHENLTGDVDPATLFAATVLHDIGLRTDTDERVRFEIDGADRAATFLTEHGLPAADVDSVWEAIALHTSAQIAERRSPMTYLVRAGVGMDFGRESEFVDDTAAEIIHAAYPRLAMVRSLVDAIVGQATRIPERAPRYSIAAELTRERGIAPHVTTMERDAQTSRWGAQ